MLQGWCVWVRARGGRGLCVLFATDHHDVYHTVSHTRACMGVSVGSRYHSVVVFSRGPIPLLSQAVLSAFRLRHLVRLQMGTALRRCRRRLGYGADLDVDEGDGVDDFVVWTAKEPPVPPLMEAVLAQRREDALDVVGLPVATLTRWVVLTSEHTCCIPWHTPVAAPRATGCVAAAPHCALHPISDCIACRWLCRRCPALRAAPHQ